MEDCYICLLSISKHNIKILDCSHSLCHYCYIHLDKPTCPFCRTLFKYSNIDKKERTKLKIEIKYQNNTLSSQLNIIEDIFYESNIRININYSGVIRRQSKRLRRRNLSPEEIIEKRKIIRKRCQINKNKLYLIN
jgi:hypothetical protein